MVTMMHSYIRWALVCYIEANEAKFLRMIKRFEVGSLPLDQHQFEDFEFVYGTTSTVTNDTITLSSHSSLEKLSVIHAYSSLNTSITICMYVV
jgi:uncharacterized Rmd1/YagE family protein